VLSACYLKGKPGLVCPFLNVLAPGTALWIYTVYPGGLWGMEGYAQEIKDELLF